MSIKFTYNTIYNVKNISDSSGVTYNPVLGSVTNTTNGNIVYQLPIIEYSPYLVFSVGFNAYQYKTNYNPTRNSFQKEVSGKSYYVYVTIDFDKILAAHKILSTDELQLLHQKLTCCLTILQVNEILHSKKYLVNICKIGKFIQTCDKINSYLTPVNLYDYGFGNRHIEYEYMYNLDLQKFVKKQPIQFHRNGGIIETNNPQDIIHRYFVPIISMKTQPNILVIIPNNMTRIWNNLSVTCITYDEILKIEKTNLKKFIHIKWDRIIIHELHMHFILGVYNMVKKMSCNNIWVINTLPLKYYFSTKYVSDTLCISDLISLLNIWMNLSRMQIKTYRDMINKFAFTKFNTMYARVMYSTKYIDEQLTIMPSKFENRISNEINKYYMNWKHKLSNDVNNMYSSADRCMIDKLDRKIHNARITLCINVVSTNDVQQFIHNKVSEILAHTDNNQKHITDFINICNHVLTTGHGHLDISTQHVRITNQTLVDELKKIQQDDLNKTANYHRYLTDTTNILATSCPICYEPFDTNEVQLIKLICGHDVCFECMIHSLTNNNECPICREFITIDKMVIVKETISEYTSNLMEYITNNMGDVIVTDLQTINNLSFHPTFKNMYQIIYIDDLFLVDKIRRLRKIHKIHIIAFNINNPQIQQLIGYFHLFNKRPTMVHVKIDL